MNDDIKKMKVENDKKKLTLPVNRCCTQITTG